MFALIFLLLALTLGLTFVCWVDLKLSRFELAAFAISVGLFGFTWIMLLTNLVLPYAVALPLGSLLTVTLSGYFWRSRVGLKFVQLTNSQRVAWSVIAVISALFWLILMFGHDLNPVNGSILSAGSTWADFGLHSSLISHQAAVSKLPLDLPVASGTPLTYPLLIDFLSTVLVKGGWSLHTALFVPGVLLAWSITQLLIAFGWRVYGKFGGAVIGMLLTLTGGSAVGLFVAISDYRSSGETMSRWLSHISQDYTGIDSLNVHFNNAVSDLLLPQRGFLFGLSLFLVTAILCHQADRHLSRKLLYSGAVLIGLMPLAHPHSFVVACFLFSGLVAGKLIRRSPDTKKWLCAGAMLLVVALPQVAWQHLAATGGGTGGFFTAGWDRLPSQSLIGFELSNFGLLLVVLVGMIIVICRRRFRKYAPWIAPFLVLFVAAQLYSLQPFAYDNLKLLFYVYIVAMLGLGSIIWNLPKYWRLVALAVAFLSFSVPGSLSIIREFQLQYVFAGPDDIALSNWAIKSTSTTDVFATTDLPTQPLATLAGRNIVLGYRGWLYSYNLKYDDRVSEITALLSGDFSSSAATKYPANYLAVSPADASTWNVNLVALSSLPIVYTNQTWTVYRLPN